MGTPYLFHILTFSQRRHGLLFWKITVSGFFTAYVGNLLFLILYLGRTCFTKERKRP